MLTSVNLRPQIFFSVLKISDPKYVHDHPRHKSERVSSLGPPPPGKFSKIVKSRPEQFFVKSQGARLPWGP